MSPFKEEMENFLLLKAGLPHHHCHLKASCSSVQRQTCFVFSNRMNHNQQLALLWMPNSLMALRWSKCSNLEQLRCFKTMQTRYLYYNFFSAGYIWLHCRHLSINEQVASLDSPISTTLHVFHAFTVCDTVSSFGERGKETAWDTATNFPKTTEEFQNLLLVQDD